MQFDMESNDTIIDTDQADVPCSNDAILECVRYNRQLVIDRSHRMEQLQTLLHPPRPLVWRTPNPSGTPQAQMGGLNWRQRKKPPFEGQLNEVKRKYATPKHRVEPVSFLDASLTVQSQCNSSTGSRRAIPTGLALALRIEPYMRELYGHMVEDTKMEPEEMDLSIMHDHSGRLSFSADPDPPFTPTATAIMRALEAQYAQSFDDPFTREELRRKVYQERATDDAERRRVREQQEQVRLLPLLQIQPHRAPQTMQRSRSTIEKVSIVNGHDSPVSLNRNSSPMRLATVARPIAGSPSSASLAMVSTHIDGSPSSSASLVRKKARHMHTDINDIGDRADLGDPDVVMAVATPGSSPAAASPAQSGTSSGRPRRRTTVAIWCDACSAGIPHTDAKCEVSSSRPTHSHGSCDSLHYYVSTHLVALFLSVLQRCGYDPTDPDDHPDERMDEWARMRDGKETLPKSTKKKQLHLQAIPQPEMEFDHEMLHSLAQSVLPW